MKTNPKRWRTVLLVVIIALAVGAAVGSQFFPTRDATSISSTQPVEKAGPGKVTMIDLGANECIPCKMMAPIIEELKKDYAGRADIIFIDVWKHPDQAKKYGIRAYRHRFSMMPMEKKFTAMSGLWTKSGSWKFSPGSGPKQGTAKARPERV